MNKSVNYQEMPLKDFERLYDDVWNAWLEHYKKCKDVIFKGDEDEIKKLNEKQMEFINIALPICEEMLRRRQNEKS